MKRDIHAAQVSVTAQEILAYLIEHPQAKDTVEGIIQWWILEQQIKRWSAQVEAALAELVSKKLVLERKGRDGKVHYSLNRNKLSEIQTLLK